MINYNFHFRRVGKVFVKTVLNKVHFIYPTNKNTTMKKVTNLLASAVVAAAILFGTNAKAQTTTTDKSPWRLGFGIEGGIPTGDIHDASKFDLGGSARLQYGLSDAFDLTLTSGYTNFFIKDDARLPGEPSGLGIVPVKLGIKAFFAQNIYFGAEAGAGFETNYGTNTKLILSPALGWANQHWDVGVNYTNYSGQSDNFGSVGLRVAYGFGL